MNKLRYKRASLDSELTDILKLQKKNLPEFLSTEEMLSEGFLTVRHDFEILKKLKEIEPPVICKDRMEVVAYILAMTEDSKEELPILKKMFNKFDKVKYLNKPISSYHYLVIGQVCIAKDYRGKGILKSCYSLYKTSFKNKYDFAITLISNRNLRSMHAHEKIGFKTINTYKSLEGEVWNILLLEW